jgi:hypothetical protein
MVYELRLRSFELLTNGNTTCLCGCGLWSSARDDYLWMPLDAVWALIDGEQVIHEAYSDTARGKHVIRIRPGDLPWGVYGCEL